MSTPPRVSVVCLSYNHERFIRDAVLGVVEQQVDFPIELIVADDCSTDATAAIAAELAERFPDKIRFVARPSNVGAYENFIQTLDLVDGDYLAICEGDDYWTDPRKLAKQVALMDADPSLSVCFHRVRVVTVDADQDDVVWPTRELAMRPPLDDLLRENFVPTLAVMYRNEGMSRETLPNVSPLDWYLHILRAKAGGMGFIDEVMGVYRRHGQGMWWASDHDPPQFWRQNAAGYFSFCDAVVSLLAGEPDRQAIVGMVAADVVNAVGRHLPDERASRYREFVASHPATAALALDHLAAWQRESFAYAGQLEGALALAENVRTEAQQRNDATIAKLRSRLAKSDTRLGRVTAQRAGLTTDLAAARRQLERHRRRSLRGVFGRVLSRRQR